MDSIEMRHWLDVSSSVNVHMPNEIFNDLQHMDFKTWKHKAFTYAYYYLITYIYRNALYGFANPENYTQEKIVGTILGDHKKVSYITKKNGLLDLAGYTETTTNYPISFFMEDTFLEFGLIKDLRKEVSQLKVTHSPRLSTKLPIKAFRRFDEEEYTGTYYSFQSTHLIEKEKFINIITNTKLGYVGLYIYAYIKTMTYIYNNEGLKWSNKQLAEYIGCNERTVMKYLKELKEQGYVESTRNMIGQDFCIGQIMIA